MSTISNNKYYCIIFHLYLVLSVGIFNTFSVFAQTLSGKDLSESSETILFVDNHYRRWIAPQSTLEKRKCIEITLRRIHTPNLSGPCNALCGNVQPLNPICFLSPNR
jgi:hypothetical protein